MEQCSNILNPSMNLRESRECGGVSNEKVVAHCVKEKRRHLDYSGLRSIYSVAREWARRRILYFSDDKETCGCIQVMMEVERMQRTGSRSGKCSLHMTSPARCCILS